MTQIKAEVIADSRNPYNDRLTTMLITFPRIILAEFNTHRMFSRNSASSRAIPFNKMVESIRQNPFIPIAWQKDHKGMQGNRYITNPKAIEFLNNKWKEGLESAIFNIDELRVMSGIDLQYLTDFNDEEDILITKQICNRPLESYMWTTVVVSATEWENFFALRCPRYNFGKADQHEGIEFVFRSRKDAIKRLKPEAIPQSELDWLKFNKGQAEIHMMALAEAMWDAYNESTPKQLEVGDWHIPYNEKVTKIVVEDKDAFHYHPGKSDLYEHEMEGTADDTMTTKYKVDISTMMCARTSYTVVGEDGKEWGLKKYLEKCKELKEANPFHASPFEHCAIVPGEEEYYANIKGEVPTITDGYGVCNIEQYATGEYSNKDKVDYYGWFGNFKGFKQYRKMFNNENITK